MGYLGKPKKGVRSSKAVKAKRMDFSIESLIVKPTDKDFCWIDLKDGSYTHNGNFVTISKYKQYWKFKYKLCLLPKDHWRNNEEMTDETLHETDQYELIYIHPVRTMITDLMSMVRKIYITFVDPNTLVYLAEVEIMALTEIEAKAALKRVHNPSMNGRFTSIEVTEEFNVEYWYDGSDSEQTRLFAKQPTTNMIIEERQ